MALLHSQPTGIEIEIIFHELENKLTQKKTFFLKAIISWYYTWWCLFYFLPYDFMTLHFCILWYEFILMSKNSPHYIFTVLWLNPLWHERLEAPEWHLWNRHWDGSQVENVSSLSGTQNGRVGGKSNCHECSLLPWWIQCAVNTGAYSKTQTSQRVRLWRCKALTVPINKQGEKYSRHEKGGNIQRSENGEWWHTERILP